MIDDQDMTPIMRSWMEQPKALPRDGLHRVLAEVEVTEQQRRRWWPFRRRAAAAPGIPDTETKPAPIPATNGHAPTVTGRTMPMFSATKFVVAGVIVALFGGVLLITQPFEQPGESVPGAATGGPGMWSPAGSLAQARSDHTATLLPDGRVLIVGDDPGDDPRLASAEVWDPATESFGPTGSLIDSRSGHTATLLPDGRVLVVGGRGSSSGGIVRALAEVWDPATATFGPAGSLAQARDDHSATLLPDGRVLIVGGSYPRCCGKFEGAEVWDSQTTSFSPSGPLAQARADHTATLLPDGRVLVVGGVGDISGPLAEEVWDPATKSFGPTGSLTQGRGRHTATLLPDGRVLVVAAGNRREGEIWDPATSSFLPAGSMTESRSWQTATALPDGRVLVVGGAAAEIWDPATESFGPAGSLTQPRRDHSATLLPDGRVLVVGGLGDEAGVSAEVWEPGDG